MVKAAIFDMDGLIINSDPYWEMAISEELQALGFSLSREAYFLIQGCRIDEAMETLHHHFPWKGKSVKEAENEVVKKVLGQIKQDGEALPGVHEIFNFFRQKKIPIAIASSSNMELIHAVLERLNLTDTVSLICSGEHETHGKPHPGIYLTTFQKLNVNPNEALIFEDSLNGVIAAKAARGRVVAVPHPSLFSSSKYDIADLKLQSLSLFNDEVLNNF